MVKPKIILIGGGGHCRACIDVIEQENRYTIAGIVEHSEFTESINSFGYPVIGTDSDLPILRNSYENALITVGQITTSKIRSKLFKLLYQLDYNLPVIISPLAYVSKHASVETGTIVMHHAIINAGAKVKRNCIINTKALIEHDSVIEDYCHISTASIINGNSTIGKGSFIGSNSAVVNNIQVANNFFAKALSLISGTISVTKNSK